MPVRKRYYHENFPAYIEFMNKLYESGVLSTEALSLSREELISQDRVSLVHHYIEWEHETSMLNADPEKIYYTPIILDLDGDVSNGYYSLCDSPEGAAYANFCIPSAAEEKAEAIIRLFDYIYTEEYAVLSSDGVEGKGYIIDENGYYEKIDTENKIESFSLFTASVGLKALPPVGIHPGKVAPYAENATASQKNRCDFTYRYSKEIYPVSYANKKIMYGALDLAIPTDEELEYIIEVEQVLYTYAEELISDLILGNKSLDDLPKYQQELEKLGLTEYLKIVQTMRDRCLGK